MCPMIFILIHTHTLTYSMSLYTDLKRGYHYWYDLYLCAPKYPTLTFTNVPLQTHKVSVRKSPQLFVIAIKNTHWQLRTYSRLAILAYFKRHLLESRWYNISCIDSDWWFPTHLKNISSQIMIISHTWGNIWNPHPGFCMYPWCQTHRETPTARPEFQSTERHSTAASLRVTIRWTS